MNKTHLTQHMTITLLRFTFKHLRIITYYMLPYSYDSLLTFSVDIAGI